MKEKGGWVSGLEEKCRLGFAVENCFLGKNRKVRMTRGEAWLDFSPKGTEEEGGGPEG